MYYLVHTENGDLVFADPMLAHFFAKDCGGTLIRLPR